MDTLRVFGSIFTAVMAGLGLLHILLEIREKLWPKPPQPHPLDARLRDIANAIREFQESA